MPYKGSSLCSDFLGALGVSHTAAYTDERYKDMPFQTLFGLSELLKEYRVTTDGISVEDKSTISTLHRPFIAQTESGLVVVTDIDSDTVTYISDGAVEHIDAGSFIKSWTGIAVTASATEKSIEPCYDKHMCTIRLMKAKRYALVVCILLLLACLTVTSGVWRNIASSLIVLFDIAGLGLTYLLLQKSLKIKSSMADRVCATLEKGGCDHILESNASKCFGLFSWSEVGFTYFTVSLMTLLVFPEYIAYLAMINACCLPYTVWSIWYQHFRAKHWCTLCVSVQCTLWLLFFCYLGGGYFTGLWPIKIELFVLGISYLTVLLAINALLPRFDRSPKNPFENGN